MKTIINKLLLAGIAGLGAANGLAQNEPIVPFKLEDCGWYIQVGMMVSATAGTHVFTGPVVPPIPPAVGPLWFTPARLIVNDGPSVSVTATDSPQFTRHDCAPHAGDVVPSTPWNFCITCDVPNPGPGARETRVAGVRTHPGQSHQDLYGAVVGAMVGTVAGPSLAPRFLIIHGSIGRHFGLLPPPGPSSPMIGGGRLEPPSGQPSPGDQDYPAGELLTIVDPASGKLLLLLAAEGVTEANLGSVYVRNGANGPNLMDLRPLMQAHALDASCLALTISNTVIPVSVAQVMASGNAYIVAMTTAHPDGRIVGALTAAPSKSSYQIQLQPGWNVVANQLSTGSNTLAEVVPVAPDFSQFYHWSNGGYTFSTFDPDLPGWDAPTLSLAPGEGGFIRNPTASPLTLTFVGEVLTPRLPLSLPYDQTVLVGRQIPAPATYEDITGLSPSEGTRLYRYDSVLQRDPTILSNWTAYTFSQGRWTPATPSVAIGEPVFIQVPTPTNPPANLPRLSVQRLTNGLIEIAWPTQAVNAVLKTASSISGPWSVVGQINPLQLPRGISERQFFRLAAASSTPAFWDLDGDGTHELEQSPDGLVYPTDTGFATLPARGWAVIQRNNGFIVYVDTQGSGHIDYGYQLADLNGDWVFSGQNEVHLIPAPEAVCGKDCSPHFRLLASVWTDQYKEPSATAARNTLNNLSPGTYVTLKVDGDCGGTCGDCGGGMKEMCVKSVNWNIQPANPAPGSGYSTSGDKGTFYSDRAGNSFQVTVTVTCTGCGKQTTQTLNFSIGW